MDAAARFDADAWLDELKAAIDVDPDAAAGRLDAPELVGAIASDPVVAVAMLRGLAALGWRTARVATMLTRLSGLPGSRTVARWRVRAQLDLAAGAAYREAFRPILPPFVLDLMADAALDPPEQRRATAAALCVELHGDPVHYLESFDTLDARCSDLAEALSLRLFDEIAVTRRALDALPPALAVELDRRMIALGGRGATMMVTLLGVGAVAAGAGVAVLLEPTLGMMAAGGGLFGASSLRGQAYRRHVRCRLAAVVADLGVTRACVREAMRRRGGRLGGFAHPAGSDRALRLLGMVAAAAHSVAADDDGDVEREPAPG